MQSTGEWGSFFPMENSAIPYNHSMAQRYFPLTQVEVGGRGGLWYEQEEPPSVEPLDHQLLPDFLPRDAKPIVVRSCLSGRPFLITAREIDKYRELGVPLPRLHYEERIERRAENLGKLELVARRSDKSSATFETALPANVSYPIWHKDEFDQTFFS